MMTEKKEYRPLSEVIDEAVEQLVADGVIEGEPTGSEDISRFTSPKRIEEEIDMLKEYTGEEMSTQELWDEYEKTNGFEGME
ncbi:hypothetical protein OAG36_01185 [bacterium]|nr:hypothetical protein [bacterium]